VPASPGLEAYEFGWTFIFSTGATVTTQALWRVLTDGIVVTSEDQNQQFGLPTPVDAGQRAASLLLGQATKVEVTPVTSDLRISFDSESALELLNTSSGYEGWHLVVREDGGTATELIALGGGELAMCCSG